MVGRRKKKMRRLCGWEEESRKHLEIYMGKGKGGGKEEILRILENNGSGEDWKKDYKKGRS